MGWDGLDLDIISFVFSFVLHIFYYCIFTQLYYAFATTYPRALRCMPHNDPCIPRSCIHSSVAGLGLSTDAPWDTDASLAQMRILACFTLFFYVILPEEDGTPVKNKDNPFLSCSHLFLNTEF
jgi:hypothetical protein